MDQQRGQITRAGNVQSPHSPHCCRPRVPRRAISQNGALNSVVGGGLFAMSLLAVLSDAGLSGALLSGALLSGALLSDDSEARQALLGERPRALDRVGGFEHLAGQPG